MAEDFDASMDEMLRAELLDAARVEELQAAIAPLRDRLADIEQRRQERRERLAGLMDAYGVCGESRPFGKVALVRTPAAVEIEAPDALPATFIRVKAEPDRAAIRKALAAGELVPGARLGNGSVTVRISQ